MRPKFTRQLTELKMRNGLKYHGAVVPLVTPFTTGGAVDEAALARLVELQVAGGVAGIFVLGTTGEGAHVPRDSPPPVGGANGQAGEQARGGFAGLGDIRAAGLAEANEFFHAGADAVVAHPPVSGKSCR